MREREREREERRRARGERGEKRGQTKGLAVVGCQSSSVDQASLLFSRFPTPDLIPITTSTRLMASFVAAEPVAGAEAILER